MTEDDVLHVQSAAHNTNDTEPTGGVISDPRVEITTATIGECIPKLRGQTSGTIDTDHEVQYQISYLENTHGSDSLTDTPGVFLANMIDSWGGGNEQIYLRGDSASDDSTKFVRLWGKNNSGLMDSEDVTLNGLSEVFGVKLFQELYRAELRLVSNGELTNAAGQIFIETAGDPNDVRGIITPGIWMATREVSLGMPAALGDVTELATRRTAPAGISWNYPGPNSLLNLPADLTAGARCAVYWRHIVQPGIGTVDMRLAFRVYGESSV